MSLYRVLVAHNGYRVNEFIETDTPVLRYVRKIEEVKNSEVAPAPDSRSVDPVRRKRTSAPKVSPDVEDRAVPDSGLPDSES